jgi:uridine phosphorylase
MPDHLGLTDTESRLAIITGNPERVSVISRYFENSKEVAVERGFVCHEAFLNQHPLLVVSAGIGAPSTAIVVEELIDLGVTTIIRLGTCGALQPEIQVGDLVISTGCVREEGTTLQYIDSTFPAIPDYVVLQELVAGAVTQASRFHVGITHCKDAYYLERPGKQLNRERVRQRWEEWRRAGVLVTEMESSVLFVLGSLRRIRTGALFINVGKVTDPKLFSQSLEIAVRIIKTAFSAIVEKNLVTAKVAQTDDDLSYLTKNISG